MKKKIYLLILIILSLNSCLNQKPNNSGLIKLFETFTQCKLPKSSKILDKDNLTGLNDGWEVAIAKVKDTIEFKQLLNKINDSKIITKRLRKNGIGYFSSKLAVEKISLIDSIYYGKEGFVFGFVKNENLIVFEKDW